MIAPFIEQQAELLIEGTEGSIVVENLRAHYPNFHTFEKTVSKVRRHVLEQDVRHTEYSHDLETAWDIVHKETNTSWKDEASNLLRRFEELSLAQQYDALRTRDSFVKDFDQLNKHMATFRLVPDNLKTFQLTREEMEKCKEGKRKTLLKRNKQALFVEHATELLQQQLHVLTNGDTSFPVQVLALLFVSGRRECEILNGRSVFEPINNYPYHVYFTGVLKKKTKYLEEEEAHRTVVIPLLCNATLFLSALARLRARQKPDVPRLTNTQVTQRYSGGLSNAQKECFPFLSKVHDLRGVYVRYVDVMFEHRSAFPLVCMCALSHDVIQECLHYSSIRIQRYEQLVHTCGNLNMANFWNV